MFSGTPCRSRRTIVVFDFVFEILYWITSKFTVHNKSRKTTAFVDLVLESMYMLAFFKKEFFFVILYKNIVMNFKELFQNIWFNSENWGEWTGRRERRKEKGTNTKRKRNVRLN